MSEKAINFKVDENLYKKIKIKIAIEGLTLKDYIINLIIKDLEKDKK
jgi:predicted DNA binding CopG/RHH family protein